MRIPGASTLPFLEFLGFLSCCAGRSQRMQRKNPCWLARDFRFSTGEHRPTFIVCSCVVSFILLVAAMPLRESKPGKLRIASPGSHVGAPDVVVLFSMCA